MHPKFPIMASLMACLLNISSVDGQFNSEFSRQIPQFPCCLSPFDVGDPENFSEWVLQDAQTLSDGWLRSLSGWVQCLHLLHCIIHHQTQRYFRSMGVHWGDTAALFHSICEFQRKISWISWFKVPIRKIIIFCDNWGFREKIFNNLCVSIINKIIIY